LLCDRFVVAAAAAPVAAEAAAALHKAVVRPSDSSAANGSDWVGSILLSSSGLSVIAHAIRFVPFAFQTDCVKLLFPLVVRSASTAPETYY